MVMSIVARPVSDAPHSNRSSYPSQLDPSGVMDGTLLNQPDPLYSPELCPNLNKYKAITPGVHVALTRYILCALYLRYFNTDVQETLTSEPLED